MPEELKSEVPGGGIEALSDAVQAEESFEAPKSEDLLEASKGEELLEEPKAIDLLEAKAEELTDALKSEDVVVAPKSEEPSEGPKAEEPPAEDSKALQLSQSGIYPLELHQLDAKLGELSNVHQKMNFLKKFSDEELIEEMYRLRKTSSDGLLLNGLLMAEHVLTREGLRRCSSCYYKSGCARCSFPHAMRYVLASGHAAAWWNKISGKAMRESPWATFGCLDVFGLRFVWLRGCFGMMSV